MGPSLIAGLFTDCDLCGGVASSLSAVFEAEDAVGLIIRASNPSSVGAVCEGRLVREVCFFNVAGGGPRDGLGFVFFRVEGFRVNVDFVVVALARLGERASAW
jgi:hypothetical protein